MVYESPCKYPNTNVEKTWPYDEYYIGERDEEGRKTGHGTHHWSGAESLERYTGELLRDSLHGVGEYSYRHRSPEHLSLTYEGHYFINYKFGYGLTSYANGRVFRGLYHSNFRWGPGVETHVNVSENVGFWRGRQLMRLTWKPSASPSPDLMSTNIGHSIVAQHRRVLVASTRIIGEINPALDLLKEYGAQPLAAAQNWIELYPKNCTDPKSQMYHADLFERAFYNNKIVTLEEVTHKSEASKTMSEVSIVSPEVYPEKFYAWNNNKMIIHMMKHSYLHHEQRNQYNVNLKEILNGPRTSFKQPAQYELDCRSILLASYLGNIRNVAQFINEYDVNPNVKDMVGNSAIMYAACGNQPEVIHFLVEAGARIDDYNDACCTPLGAALIIYACVQRNIPLGKMIQAIIPPPGVAAPLGTAEIVSDWQIERQGSSGTITNAVVKTSSNRTLKSVIGTKKMSSIASKKNELSPPKDKQPSEAETKKEEDAINESVMFSDDKRLYYNLIRDYNIKITKMLSQSGVINPIPYIFEINDMVIELDLAEVDEQRKVADKPGVVKTGKVSKMLMSSNIQQDLQPDTAEIDKENQLKNILTTIERLLMDGANPRHVNCPQPALFIAIASYCPDLVQLMVKYGADVNKKQPQMLGYTFLDIAISGPLTEKNAQIIRTLLESGAKADHRLPINETVILDPDVEKVLGPTLLHVMLAKKNLDPESDDKIREEILELLLQYGSDPTGQYNGRAAMDIAITKSLGIFDIFIESPNTDLNTVINSLNQTILVKMFYLPFAKTIPIAQRLQMLTNLLLFGADPLLECQNGEDHYDNLFVYTRKIVTDSFKNKPGSPAGSSLKKSEVKNKKEINTKNPPKLKTVGKSSSKSVGKVGNVGDEQGDYKQAVSLVTDCARLLIIRWLQAKLMKELINIVDKYKHRHWNIILKEYKNGKCCGLWLNPVRCLEIWDILKNTKNRIYNDKRILKYVLCIVHYYFNKTAKILREQQLTSQVKSSIELEVAYFIREHSSSTAVAIVSRRPYVMPELLRDDKTSKFNVCFECAIPLEEDAKITCGLCKLIDFCSFDCMGLNIERYNCHPCSNYLKKKYFPTPETSETEVASEPPVAPVAPVAT